MLDRNYAAARQSSAVLEYRYRTRAFAAWEAIQKHLPFKGFYEVLDMGCAEGRTLMAIHGLLGGRGRFVGLEASDSLISAHPPLPDNLELMVGDVMSPPPALAAGSFDVVCALALLEHLKEPRELGRVAARLLKPGGLFIASCPNPLWDDVAGKLGLMQDDAHLSEMGPEQMIDVAAQVGAVSFQPFMSVSVGALPYLGLPISPSWSCRYDELLRALPLPMKRHLFVNQLVVAKKPKGK